ncbi:MAG TPA: hypothetical protein VNL14_15025 [Candidatus Acidoferrales bacterium]|nr:hypothetical protein [Candidatus Acidoferrales bacterium]
MLFDVRLQRHEVFANEFRGALIRVRFGFQPNARASRRRRAEIDEQRSFARFRIRQGGIDILYPLNSHSFASFCICLLQNQDSGRAAWIKII